MNSRERIIRAFNKQDTDYLPCSIYFNPLLNVKERDCSKLEDRTLLALDLGTDPVISVGIGHFRDQKVTTKTVKEDGLLHQEWKTPCGTLSQSVKLTDFWKNRDEIIWTDHTSSDLVKPLIETPDDVNKVSYIFQPMSENDLQRCLVPMKRHIELAQKYKLPVVCNYGLGLANFLFMMGPENAILFAMDESEAFKECAQIFHRAEMRAIECAKKAGAHILKRFGGYEMTNFYNPEIFQDVVLPLLKKEVAYAHEHDLLIYYRVVTGMKPVLDDIAACGFDCIEGGEPYLSHCSFEDWHAAFNGKCASWTGISTPVLLGGNDPEKVRQEVHHAVDVFGKHGFILGVTNSIRPHFPFENTIAMIDAWKKVR